MKRLALALLAIGCIERPYEEPAHEQPQLIDRAALRDVFQTPPPDAVQVGAVFGNAAELLAYRLEPAQLIAGQRAKLTLYWRCRSEMEPWHIFVHLDSATSGERIHGEHDPAGGRYPTDSWRPGEIIADAFYFVPGQTPLQLFLGFYSTGDQRLPLTAPGKGRDDGNNRLLAGVLPMAH